MGQNGSKWDSGGPVDLSDFIKNDFDFGSSKQNFQVIHISHKVVDPCKSFTCPKLTI